MVEAFEEQRDIADIDQLAFDDRLAMMLEREVQHRDHKSCLGHLRQAQLRIRADVQDVDCRAGRGIARTTLTQLATGDWIRQAFNLILVGPTGSGKTFVACALAHQACRQKQSVLYRCVPELVSEFARARDRGTHHRLMRRLARVSLLVLDDWEPQNFSAEGRRDLLEIVEQRHARASLLIVSQIPVEHWPKVIADRPSPTPFSIASSTTLTASRSQASPGASATGHRCWTEPEGARPRGRVHGHLRRRGATRTPGTRAGHATVRGRVLKGQNGSPSLAPGWPKASYRNQQQDLC